MHRYRCLNPPAIPHVRDSAAARRCSRYAMRFSRPVFISIKSSLEKWRICHSPSPPARGLKFCQILSTGEGTSPRHHPQTQASRFAGVNVSLVQFPDCDLKLLDDFWRPVAMLCIPNINILRSVVADHVFDFVGNPSDIGLRVTEMSSAPLPFPLSDTSRNGIQ